MTTALELQPTTSWESQLIAAELRAEMGRQNVSQRELARRMGVPQPRVSTRIGRHASVEIDFVALMAMTKALDLTVEGFLSPLLPRLDSNQQPSGYLSLLVSDAQVVDLAAFRAGRAA